MQRLTDGCSASPRRHRRGRCPVCGIDYVTLRLHEGTTKVVRLVSDQCPSHGRNFFNSLTRGSPSGRAMLDRETVHVQDLAASESDFPDAKTRGVAFLGVRTALIVPLLRRGYFHRRDQRSSKRGSPFLREADPIAQNVCRPGCHRH